MVSSCIMLLDIIIEKYFKWTDIKKEIRIF